MELNRRDFLKGALTTGIVAAGAGVGLTGCAPAAKDGTAKSENGVAYPEGLQASDFDASAAILEPIKDFAEEKTYDVVVVGAGTGGVPAALSALEEGATVAVLQKESKPVAQGGTCSGVLLDQSDEQGVMNYLQGFLEDCRWRADRKLAETYCKYSGEAIRWTQVRTAEAGFPPYQVRPTAVAEYDDGSKCARRSIVFGPKPYNNGTMIEHLAEFAASKGVEFFYSTPGVQLIKDDSGRVTGVVGKDGNKFIKFNATKGVILSTGDYQNNQSLVERYCPDVKEFDRKQNNKTGDGILMSMAAGAGLVPVGHAHMMHDFDSGPMFNEPFLMVNENGERFMNEDCVFEEVNCVLRNQPKPGWYSQIFDDNYIEQVTDWGGKPTDKEKIKVYMPAVEMDRSAESGANVIESLIDTHCCDTLDELAEKLGIPADALKKSVARYNEMVDAGFDEDFGKQKKYLKKIEKAPFWGIHKHVRVSALCAGVTVNENYQALSTDGEVIEGLWVTGFSAGQLCGSPDWSMYQGGMSAGHCIMTGRICGIQAATGGKLESAKPVTEADVEALAK
ncbi:MULTISPECIES: FAD-dependent oxidoreductase [Gordonibacter]|uniref:FAD-dependent oxidoreductase n=1 Tax=Gordonibacter faecis TaxID=3047475 RepID=A0ABT7DKZ1_9ACTN|nr:MULTISPECIES: FAD-dependent oxidoreductase [unclassified Gordonibacter]MDJ1650202.1 FAD-dependent oxidoreductase [Gordonibacter sp. KGMB12511]HIW75964.1 FAD-binding protein [Candidatus Gordonibacter avicola]